MKRSRFTEKQIIGILREHEAGVTTAEVCRKHGISDATFLQMEGQVRQHAGSDARKLKALEVENRKPKKLRRKRLQADTFKQSSFKYNNGFADISR